jgi:hypothetical protein
MAAERLSSVCSPSQYSTVDRFFIPKLHFFTLMTAVMRKERSGCSARWTSCGHGKRLADAWPVAAAARGKHSW